MREKLLSRLADVHAEHPWRMITFVLVMTVIFMAFSSQLDITMRWSDLLPEKDIRTLQFNKILDEFSTATSLVIMVQGDEKKIKSFAESVSPKILALVDSTQNAELKDEIATLEQKLLQAKQEQNSQDIQELEQEITSQKSLISRKLVKRIDYKNEIDFLKKNGLLLVKEDDLKNIKDMYYDANLVSLIENMNNSMEKEYVGQKESISTRQKEDNAVVFLNGIKDLITLLQNYNKGNVDETRAKQVIDKLLYGDPFMLSYDEDAIIMNIIPTFSLMEMDKTILLTDVVQELVDNHVKAYPGVQAGLTGMIAVSHDEMVYSEQSLGITSVIAFIAILVMLIIAFRMLMAPFYAIINLIIGIIWAMGVAAITVGQLNMMTYMFTVILIGLGIDFSIHIITGFTEYRAKHLSIKESLELTLSKIGRGILTGGITTSIAFLALVISSSRGMKEMGLVSGFGLIAIMISTFLFLPALLVLREKKKEQKGIVTQKRDLSFIFLGKTAGKLGKHPVITLTIAFLFTIILTIAAFRINFDHNYMNIEPEGLTSIALQDSILDKFDLSMDYGMVLSETIDESRRIAEEYRKTGTVAIVDDISMYLPSVKQQQARKPHIHEIQNRLEKSVIQSKISSKDMDKLITELERLEMNIMEMQDMAYLGGQDKVDKKCKELVGDPSADNPTSYISLIKDELASNPTAKIKLADYQKQAAPYFKSSVLNMCNVDQITFKDLPESIKDRYSNKTRDQFMVTVFPSGNIWQDAKFLEQFSNDLERISPNATGMPPVFRALIDVIGQDGRNAALLTIILMFFVLWYDFKKPGYALIAMIPLIAGVFWMVGAMHLLGLQLTVMNVMGLPLIIGIGIDDGVHVIHRWISEGKSNLQLVYSSTGKAILLTSLTTMMGFGSLVFSIWRGFGQLGSALFIGVAMCFLTTLFILAGIIGLLSKKN